MNTRIIRTRRRHRFAQIELAAIDDVGLSWAARGLLVFVRARPDNWRVNVRHLIKQGDLGRDGVYALLDELGKRGYVLFRRKRNLHGQFAGGDYYVRETLDEPFPVAPHPASPDLVRPDAAKPDRVQPDPVRLEELTTTEKKLEEETATTDQVKDTAVAAPTDDLRLAGGLTAKESRFAQTLLEDLEPELAQMVANEWAGARQQRRAGWG